MKKKTLRFAAPFIVALLLFILFQPAPVSSQIQVPSATPRATATAVRMPERSAQRAQTATPVVPEPVALILSEPLETYLYHLDNSRQRVFIPGAPIPSGRLVKVSTCLEGYAQVEYQPDPARPGMWNIAFAKMDRCK